MIGVATLTLTFFFAINFVKVPKNSFPASTCIKFGNFSGPRLYIFVIAAVVCAAVLSSNGSASLYLLATSITHKQYL